MWVVTALRMLQEWSPLLKYESYYESGHCFQTESRSHHSDYGNDSWPHFLEMLQRKFVSHSAQQVRERSVCSTSILSLDAQHGTKVSSLLLCMTWKQTKIFTASYYCHKEQVTIITYFTSSNHLWAEMQTDWL